MYYCPIIIKTLNRYEHFKACIESLEKCDGAQNTEVFISVDYPPNDKYVVGHEKIVKYLKSREFAGFKKVSVFYQDENLGSKNNFTFLLNQVKDNYSFYISTEDDNAFEIGYLNFMNGAITKFMDDKDFIGVSGYQVATKFESQAWIAGNSTIHEFWGFGTSYHNVQNIITEIQELYTRCLSLKQLWKVFRKDSRSFYVYINFLLNKPGVYFERDGRISFIDYTIRLYAILNDKFIVQPAISYVRNYGIDGSGENCGEWDYLQNIEKYKKTCDEISFDFSENKRMDGRKLKKYIYSENVVQRFFMAIGGWLQILLFKTIGANKTRSVSLGFKKFISIIRKRLVKGYLKYKRVRSFVLR